MNAPGFSRVTGRMIAGGVLILLGVLFTLDNFGLVDAGDVFRYWPLVLIGFGLLKIVQCRYAEQRVAGGVVVALGIVLLLRTLHVLTFHLRELWPVIFVVGGALLVWRSTRPKNPEWEAENTLAATRDRLSAASGSTRDSTSGGGFLMNDFAFLGGGERIVRSPDFRGGEVTAIMGGFTIDLRGAGIVGDEAVLEIFALWGGVELKVPEEWIVSMRGMPILGAFSETQSGTSTPLAPGVPRKTLVITGTAIMGGVEVKH